MHSETDIPFPSELLDDAGHGLGYRWLLNSKERAHIAGLLDCDVNAITLRGNIMNRERSVCKKCGKHSGLDDLVHNALHLNVHNATFMLDVLQNGPKNEIPAHWILCSGCGMKHEQQMWWVLAEDWVNGNL